MEIMTETTTKMITLTIDGQMISTPSGSTILQAARGAGIYIPTLCYLECLPDYGSCRLCMVQVEQMRGFPTSCTTPAAKEMEVSTKTVELQKLRREILELILSEHPYTCLICKDKKECSEFMHSTRKVTTTTGCNFCTSNGNCELQHLVEYLELKDIRFPIIYRNIPPVTDNPFYTLDYNLCILCGRCVRICNEERYSEVLAFINRGNSALVGTAFNETQKKAGCEYCGACVDVCPTGSLSEKMGNWAGIPESSTATNCIFCGIGCSMTVNTKGNRIINIGPEPGKKDNPPQLCLRGKFIGGDITHHPDRISRPHIKKDGKWREVKWEEATSFIAMNLKKYEGDQFGLIGSAHDTIENSFILQHFARKTMKSANVDISPTSAYTTLVKDIHEYYATYGHVEIDTILAVDKVYVIGSQTQWSHPIIENRIRKAFKSGKEVIVASSTANRTVNFSTDFQRYNKGCEHIFLYRLMEKIITRKNTESVMIIIGDEVLHSDRAEENFNTLMHLASFSASRIKILFLLSEGNRYGATMAGMNPLMLPGFIAARKKGLTTTEMLKKQKAISALYLVGDIPYSRVLKGLKFFVQQNMFFTPASEYAQVFLPLANNMESEGHIINLEGKPIRIQPVITMDDNIQPTSQIINSIAMKMTRKAGFVSTQSMKEQTQLLIKELTEGKKLRVGKRQAPTPDSRSKHGQLTLDSLKRHHFHYMGNSLADIIPDLQKVLEK